MAINIRKYIDITSGIGGRNKADRRDLMGLVLTSYGTTDFWNNISQNSEDKIYPISEFATADEVRNAFGHSLVSDEYRFATKYFGFLSKSITKSKLLKFAHWQKELPSDTPVCTNVGFGYNYDKPFSGQTFTQVGKNRCYALDLFRGEQGVVNFSLSVEGCEYKFTIDFSDILASNQTDENKYVAMVRKLNDELRFLIAGNENINQYHAIDLVHRHQYQTAHGETPGEGDDDWLHGLDGQELYQFVVRITDSTLDGLGKYRPKCTINAANFHVDVNWDKTGDNRLKTEPTPESCPGIDLTFGSGFEFFGLGSNDGTTTYKADSAVEAIAAISEIDDNFGSFTFLDELGFQEVVDVAKWNHANNYKFLFSYSNDRELLNNTGLAYALSEYSGTVVTERPQDSVYQTFDRNRNVTYEEARPGRNYFSAYIPMALLATTNYRKENSTKNFMYQFFTDTTLDASLKQDWWCEDPATVRDWQTARELDKYNVNYIGETQQAGKIIRFYQDGYNTDGLDTACYCNEVWLKDAILCELLNAFITMERVPANTVGSSILEHKALSVINEAIGNGVIMTNKELTLSQKEYIDRMVGVEGAWGEVATRGYYLKITLVGRDGDKSTAYTANYVLMYAKGDSIRKVEGSNILF